MIAIGELGKRKTAEERKISCPVLEKSINIDYIHILLGKYNFTYEYKKLRILEK